MSTKNRFGPAPEEQFYQMTEKGLTNVDDVGALLGDLTSTKEA